MEQLSYFCVIFCLKLTLDELFHCTEFRKLTMKIGYGTYT